MKLLDKINPPVFRLEHRGIFCLLEIFPHRRAGAGPYQPGAVLSGQAPAAHRERQLEQLISTGFTTVSALVNWWFNNSFTKEPFRPMLSLSACGRA